MQRTGEPKRPLRSLLVVVVAALLAAGCSHPSEAAAEGFRQCMESAGFALDTYSAGSAGDGILVAYQLLDGDQEPAATQAAQVCVASTSQRIGQRVFLQD